MISRLLLMGMTCHVPLSVGTAACLIVPAPGLPPAPDYWYFPPPRRLAPPPASCTNALVRALVDIINEATDAIPGWDEYAKTGYADPEQLWDGVVRGPLEGGAGGGGGGAAGVGPE